MCPNDEETITLEEFIEKMKGIKDRGYIKSHRHHDTGIGKTLEDLLGITENNIAGPDFSIYELKSSRKDSVSMLTLFTKTPRPKGANKRLLEAFGYTQRKMSKHKQTNLVGKDVDDGYIPLEDKELHVTVNPITPNSVGLILEITDDRLIIGNDKGVEAYYDKTTLKDTFESKYHNLVYVLAESRGGKGQEQFWFNEAYLLENFGFDNFTSLVEEGLLKIDIRIGHYPDGRIHDHGTGFRILPKYLPKCFATMKRLL